MMIDTMTALPHLPPPMWAHAMDFLPMQDVLKCTDPFFNHEVSPLVRTLRIQKESDVFRLDVCKQFPNVEHIAIDFVLQEPIKLALFLYRFDNLARVDFSPIVYSGEEGNLLASELIRLLCHAYERGGIKPHVVLHGLLPSKTRLLDGWRCFAKRFSAHEGCRICRSVCQSFPPQQLLEGTIGAAHCFPIATQMEMAHGRMVGDVDLDAIVWKVLTSKKHLHRGIVWYSPLELSRLDWLVQQKGAKFDLAALMAEIGASGVDQKLFDKLCDWGLAVSHQTDYPVVGVQASIRKRRLLAGLLR